MKKLSRHFIPNLGTLIILGLFLFAQAVGAFPFKGVSTQSATLPALINYQGRLNDAGGNPVPDGNYAMQFALYDAATGGTQLWKEVRMGGDAVAVSNGLFNVMLGAVTPLPDPFPTGDLWLGVTVGNDAEMMPRERLGSVPFALVADASTGSGLPSGAIVMWSGSLAAIPEGWALCDGTGGTPDLRDRFIVGAGSSYSVGDTGGAASVTLTTSQMPAHNHSASTNSTGSHSHSASTNVAGGIEFSESENFGGPRYYGMATENYSNNWTMGEHSHSITINSAGAHSHSVTVNNTGGGQPHENRPPYYSLAFICKQ